MNHIKDKTKSSLYLYRSIGIIIECLIYTILVNAQSSSTDGTTPNSLAPGAPAGSYRLSGFEHVNLFNGNLNFSLPLMEIGGRGDAQYVMLLKIEQKWRAIKQDYPPPGTEDMYYPRDEWWSKLMPGYGPGVLEGRRSVDGDLPYERYCEWQADQVYTEMLTRLTFIFPDGSELELRDQLTNGKPAYIYDVPCGSTGNSRGRVFISTDGSSTTFISDSPIHDYYLRQMPADKKQFGPSGVLLFKNGVRYRIDSGLVSWIRDRNGNKLVFEYDGSRPNRVSKITDSLNRQVIISYDDGISHQDAITFKGANGATRVIKINYAEMSNVLQLGNTIQTNIQLFPSMPMMNGIRDTSYNPRKVSSVELPNQLSYRFRYNKYGELAKVELPTGGKYEYQWGAGMELGIDETGWTGREINRAVKTRSVYRDVTTLDTKTTYMLGSTVVNNRKEVIVETRNVSNVLLEKSLHFFHLYPGDGLKSTEYNPWKNGLEYQTDFFNIVNDSPVLQKRVNNIWQQRAPVSWWAESRNVFCDLPECEPANDPRIVRTITTLVDSNQVTKTSFSYDEYNNKTDVYEYDYGNGTTGMLLRHQHTDYQKSGYDTISGTAENPEVSSTIHIRNLPVRQIIYDSVGNQKALTNIEYDNYDLTNGHAPLIDRPNISGLDSAFVIDYKTRGNITAVNRWMDTTNIYLTTFNQYDIAGNNIKTVDSRGNTTTIDYTDRFGSPDGEARSNSGASELGGEISYAFPTKVTNTLGQEAYTQYDYYLGKSVDVEDANGIVSSSYYNDVLDRSTQVVSAVNTSSKKQSAITYNDTSRTITTTSDLNVYGDNKLRSESIYDGLGRTIESRSYENDTDYIHSLTQYDALGRSHKTSNPHRLNEPTYWTTITYDSIGRVINIEMPDGAYVWTQYNGNQVTATDQAGKVRKSEVDAIGRLTRVIESPGSLNQESNYFYNALDNLEQVVQGPQTRTFAYDSLSRLTSAKNPESGTITYSYDANGNLIEKTDARGIKTTMTYDALNRVKSKVYADSTPRVDYFYDDYATLPSGAPAISGGSPKGRLIGVTYGGGNEGTYYKYDGLGRIDNSTQRLSTADYPTSYEYNVAGSIATERRKTRINSMSYDDAGRLLSEITTSSPYTVVNDVVKDIRYTSFGAIENEKLGNNLIHSRLYNERQQPVRISLGKADFPESVMRIDYIFGTAYDSNAQDHEIIRAHNNGNIARIKHYQGGALQNTQTFQYDPVNRMRYAVEHNGENYSDGARAWFQTFDYDRFGNRGINVTNTSDNADTANSALQLADFSTANNRINRTGFVYDASGNLIAEPGKNYTYDAENRIVRAIVEGGDTSVYIYDGSGRRVKKIIAGVGTRYVYGAGGELQGEYKDSNGFGIKEYIYRGGELIATKEPFKNYVFATSDHLGSPRVWTDNTMNVIAGGRHDYLPFGEEIFAGYGTRTTGQGYASNTQADGQRKQFTSKERDVETGLDYFGERYYASTQGRFISPDPLMASARAGNPQTWNRYVYVLNNPLRYIDPDGLMETDAWGQLTDDEQKIIAAKLRKKKKETDQQAFNRVMGTGTAEQITGRVLTVKNFIDNAGGHDNSKVWQQISSLEGAWSDAKNPGAAALHLEVKNSADFIKVLKESGKYDVNADYEKFNHGGDHRHSARYVTGWSEQPGMHLVQQNAYPSTRFDLHFDPRSSAFINLSTRYSLLVAAGMDINKAYLAERGAAGLTHGSPKSSAQVRQELKNMGIVPKKEP